MKDLALVPIPVVAAVDLVVLHLLSPVAAVAAVAAVADAKKEPGTALTARVMHDVRVEDGLLHKLLLQAQNAQLEFRKISKLLPSNHLPCYTLPELHTVQVDELSSMP